MSKREVTVITTESFKLTHQLYELEKKEKKNYEALAALLRFIQKGKKNAPCKVVDFNKFKKVLLENVQELESAYKSKQFGNEPKFNVKHYERAILCASDVTYRDMAIQAAYKDLTLGALCELIAAVEKQCRSLTRQVKDAGVEFRKIKVGENMQPLWDDRVVEPRPKDEKTEPAAAA